MTERAASPRRGDFRFFHRLRVRWAEVDMQKIVFNVHYAMYLDTAFADYWRALSVPYEAAMHELGGDLYMKKLTLEYHASAHYDEVLDIGLRCARIGNSSILFLGGIFRGDQLLVSGELLYVFADPATQTSKPVPESLRELFLAYEAGEPTFTIKVGNWTDLGEAALRIRSAVFVKEQGVPESIERDDQDATAVHAVVYNRLGMPIATGRLLQAGPQVARIGRMAVTRVLRAANIGREIMRVFEREAQKRGDKEIMMHAQRSAEGFYQRLGYSVRGEPFEEANLAHVEMVKKLG